MPRNIFRVFNPNATPEDRAEKRRAQLRQAQQTYRERKDRYTKALEAEIADGRAREAHLVQENERLHDTVKELRAALALARGQANGQANGHDQRHDHGHDHGYDFNNLSPWSAQLEPPTPLAKDSPYVKGHANTNSYSPAMFPSPVSASDASAPAPAPPPSDTSVAGWSPTPGAAARVGDLDPTDVGMEFVLTLEQPCLAHLHGDPASPLESNNHALTVSSKLCAYASTTTPSPKTAPHNILEAMLRLSPALGVPDTSLTPVQAWHRVSAQPQFARLELGTLQALATTLRGLVQCHGFGAVIAQDVFADRVEALLVGS
ncbi:uncharacterized protein SPSK_02569 [Sporothrix schenckii 1099-18]|uniref:BZIP domain-containing protein n=2 Tax=Sporothrix schenckii TaxID=29908 RepID=U7PN75_SPOS1|nr:uncharacterized protein SPSK_02569 [Sporothrix schenckii 1099-18]ERS97088.1 hypothetical protein HMPREF1624_06417 [Sporothrix schenckii ATCC 58251]KJR86294.1 hypothetical protein SPSK_02569 [Sporothrix schenckii 1099-18]